MIRCALRANWPKMIDSLRAHTSCTCKKRCCAATASAGAPALVVMYRLSICRERNSRARSRRRRAIPARPRGVSRARRRIGKGRCSTVIPSASMTSQTGRGPWATSSGTKTSARLAASGGSDRKMRRSTRSAPYNSSDEWTKTQRGTWFTGLRGQTRRDRRRRQPQVRSTTSWTNR